MLRITSENSVLDQILCTFLLHIFVFL